MAPNITAGLDNAHTDLFRRANHVLDEIQRYILPWDPHAALDLLTEFISHRAFDTNNQWLPESRVCQLFVRAVDLAMMAAHESVLLPKSRSIN